MDIAEASKYLPELIEAALNGQEVVIAREDQPVVKLVPVSQVKSHPQFGSASGLVTMSDDFDQMLEDFNDYVK
jgi:antitoxin (DNA-binding transcriptional repressor) of toxin-antitoxin stability system